MNESISFSPDTIATREENLSLYRSARKENSAGCPNLPLTLLVEVTSRCNLSCEMCNVHHDTKSGADMTDAMLGQAYRLSITAAVVYPFGLGESLMHPGISSIVNRFKSMEVKVGLITNGMLLNKKLSKDFIIAGLDQIVVSIDAADPELFSRIRKGGDILRISENVREMNRLKRHVDSENPLIAINVVAGAFNFYHLPRIIELAARLQVLFVTITPVTIHDHIPGIRGYALKKDMPDWTKILRECKSAADSSGITLDMSKLYYIFEGRSRQSFYNQAMPCPEPFRFMGIRANGDIFPCCNWDVRQPIARIEPGTEVRDNMIEDIWRSPQWNQLRRNIIAGEYPGICRKCMDIFTRPVDDEYIT